MPGAAAPAPAPVELVIDSPSSGGKVESKMHMAEIRGTAIAGVFDAQPGHWGARRRPVAVN